MISIKNKNLWKFSSIPGIEESTFNKVLEKFYDLGISGLVEKMFKIHLMVNYQGAMNLL